MNDSSWVAVGVAIVLTVCHVLNSLIREYYRSKNGNHKPATRRPTNKRKGS